MTAVQTTALSPAALTALAGFRQVAASEVKAWGRDNGFTVNDGRGRMAHDLVEAFNTANARRKVQYILGSGVRQANEFPYTTATGRKGKFTATVAQVRAWAGENGHEVAAKGRLPQSVLDAYGQAHAPVRKSRKTKADASE